MKAFDANDWIYQTWAYEKHDVGTTPGFNGDTEKALGSIKAKTLILTGTKDLLNPEFEPQTAAHAIKEVRVITISPARLPATPPPAAAFPPMSSFSIARQRTFSTR